MKTLSLKLDDKIFDDAEEITAKLKLDRNRYINEAVSIYNLFNKRRLLKNQLAKESKLISKDSMDILHEFEKFVDENIFRYPGPIPFSKETAVLMLADSVEAASRSLKDPDAISISDLVERIIDYKLDQGQLTNSNITLKDIDTIKLIFKTMLMGIYHVRIDYEID